MHHGFIKIGACTPSIRVADCTYNGEAIIKLMNEARKKGVKIAVFPELCITGSTCGDLFLQDTLLRGAQTALSAIVEASEALDMIAFVGLPVLYGGKVYNCTAAVSRGELLGIVPKSAVADTRVFCGYRGDLRIINYAERETVFGTQLLFSCTGVSDLVIGAEIGSELYAPMPISMLHAAAGATLIVNPAAEAEIIGKAERIRSTIRSHSERLNCAYVRSEAGEGESTTDMVFAGHNIIAENGKILGESSVFESDIMLISEIDVNKLAIERRRNRLFPELEDEGYETVEFDLETEETTLTRSIEKFPFVPAGNMDERCERVLSIQAHGLKTRLERAYAKTAVIGISGGLDSCLALLAAVRAVDLMNRPRQDIIAVTMPCFGTTERTKNNAVRMSELLGVTLMTVDIGEAVKLHLQDIGHDINDHSVTYENAQARERTQVIMDIANRTGGMVIGTGDISELALGWATYNGDHMSMYGVNASVPKTLIRRVVSYEGDRLGGELREVLYDVVATPVSPELLPAKDGEIAQKTEDLVGPYELHDFILYYAVRYGFEPDKVKRLLYHAFLDSYSGEELDKWLSNFYRRFFSQQFKRSCLPDGPMIGKLTLSPRGGWAMPSDAANTLWKNKL